MLDAIKRWFQDALEWLLDAFLWVPRKLWAELLEALSTAINAIPVPDFVTDLSAAWASVGPGLMYFFDVFQFEYGIPLILGAFLLRFIVRRLPVIG